MANFQRIIELFTKKIAKKLFKIWSWDPGSKIRDPGSGKNPFRIPDPGVKKAPDPGSRIRIRNTGENDVRLGRPCEAVGPLDAGVGDVDVAPGGLGLVLGNLSDEPL